MPVAVACATTAALVASVVVGVMVGVMVGVIGCMPMVIAMIPMVVVIVTTMVVMLVVVVLVAGGRRHDVGAPFGVERRLDRRQTRTETIQHRLDGGVTAQPQAVGKHLDRNVPVAEMPGEPRQRIDVRGPHLDQRLGLGHDLDQAAVVEHQSIAHAQHHGLRQIDHDRRAVHGRQGAVLQASAGVIQDHAVDDPPAVDPGGGDNAGGASHGVPDGCRSNYLTRFR